MMNNQFAEYQNIPKEKFEFAEEVSKQFGFNVFEEFKKLIDNKIKTCRQYLVLEN